jgi:hypothetical protein
VHMTATALVWASLLGSATAPTNDATTVTTERSLTQYGITWTFAKPAPVGQFVTGDWWVVGPVTVQSVSPSPTADRHGSVVNPPARDKQGYDGRLAHFDASLRAQFPRSLKPGDSLVSTASLAAIGDRTANTVGSPTAATTPAASGRSCLPACCWGTRGCRTSRPRSRRINRLTTAPAIAARKLCGRSASPFRMHVRDQFYTRA